MADLREIEYPDYLNRHTLTEQELGSMNDQQQRIAKDWNIMGRKIDWLISAHVESRNLIVEHDRLLETWKKVMWISGILAGGGGGAALVIKLLS